MRIKLTIMCQIMDILHKYVPTVTTNEIITLPNGETYSSEDDSMFELLARGDQLTVTRMRSATGIRRSHDKKKDKLNGLIPVIEDWHSRMTLMQVNFKLCLDFIQVLVMSALSLYMV